MYRNLWGEFVIWCVGIRVFYVEGFCDCYVIFFFCRIRRLCDEYNSVCVGD